MPPSRLRDLLVPVLPACLLLVLGAVQLSRHFTLWYDEDYTLLAVRTPLPQLLSAVWHTSGLVPWLTVAPSFNAPYYLLLHAWCALAGTSTVALRLPSLLCSAAAVAVVAALARRLGGRLAGLTAGLLAATGPLLVQQAVQARSYGAAELTTALTVLLLVRRQQEGGRRLPLVLAAGAAGLLHWFTLPVLAGLVLWSLLRARRGDALLLTVAALPALALVAVQLHGSGAGAPVTQHVGAALAWHALSAWSSGAWPLTACLLAALAVALVRSAWRSLLMCWLAVPLGLCTLLELVQPSYFGRYFLFALLGLAVGAALGVAALPGRWRPALAALLVGASLLICVPRLQSTALEHPDVVVALLEAQQSPGQPVAAADGRAALELVEEVGQEQSRLAADLLLRPAHVPTAGSARTAWVVRSGSGAGVPASPDDAFLASGGWQLASATVVHGSYGDLTVQRWTR